MPFSFLMVCIPEGVFCGFILQQSIKSFPLGFTEMSHKHELLKG